MPVLTPDFGLDPALMAPQPEPSPMDAVTAALEALAASGAEVGPLQPSLYGTGYQDTNLIDPTDPEEPVHLPPGRPASQFDASGQQLHGYPLPEGSVTVTGQQRMPSVAEANARIRQETLDDPSAALAPDDVQGHAYREQRAMDIARMAKQRELEAQLGAQRQEVEEQFQVHQQHAFDLETANSLYQQSRQAAYSEADLETQAWMTEYQQKAQEEPNPGRWWDNLTGLGKALWALSLVFGGASAAITPGAQNVALELIRHEIDQDIRLQKERLGRELEGLRMKGQLMEKRQARNLTDMADDNTMFLGRLEALKQAYLARAAAPGAANMQAGLAAVDAWFATQEADLAGKKYQTAVQIKENQLQRAHAAHLAQLSRNLQWNMQSREIAKAYDLAALNKQAAADQAKLAMMKDVEGVPLRLGAKMVGSPMGEVIQVGKENAVKMRGTFDTANRRYDALRKVKSALEDGSFAERMSIGDPELISASRYLGYTTGKELDPQGRLSDQDVKYATAIDLGFDPGGGPWDRAKFEVQRKDIAKMIEREMQSMPKKVSMQAETYLNPNLVGNDARIVWAPQQLFVPEQATPNMTEALSSAGMGPNVPVPSSVEDFERRRAMEDADAMYRGRVLPEYDKGTVNEFAASVQGVSPKMIRQLADVATKKLNTNTDPWAGSVSSGDQTTKLAIESVALKAIQDSEKRVKELNKAAHNFGVVQGLRNMPKPTRAEIIEMARKGVGLTEAPEEIEEAVQAALKAYDMSNGWQKLKESVKK